MKINIKVLFLIFFFFFVLFFSFILTKIDNNFKNFFDALWFSIITMSTVGYGDITPESVSGKILTIIFILLSIVAVSLFTATITSKLIADLVLEKEDYKNVEKLKNHLIICGYKSQLKSLIKNFVETTEFNMDEIVLIHKELTPDIKAIIEELKHIKFVEGDFTDEVILQKARVKYANKAIVLSDGSDESDSKVLGTVILLKSLNPDIYTIVEISNIKFEKYLEKIKCDEIILSEEYNKYLLSKAIVDPGISKVVASMLQNEDFKILKADEFIDRYYFEIFDEFLQKNIILIGVIENYGNIELLKKKKIKQLQFQEDISHLPEELHKIKHLELNKIVFSPKKDYKIKEFSAIIILKRKNEV